ncbi:XRE family transcriptional regulator [Chlorobium sp. N1]|uniref:helix-turn-helix domain-containing protein n=1 Tax=Chlorobium sp. N1 TaxID=2491138 RepID=UPI00103E7F65|nr:XRE family transcriptional regulator [Chlorobium sp. N1]TCD48099.1 ImmA/IrrE family metallo-endopeptidase [Chlorobium sp. N1]
MDLRLLAGNVRRLRARRRFSQKELAEAAGLSLPAIKNLELQKSEPRMSSLQAIARALRVPLHDLFTPVRQMHTVRFRSARRMQNRENVLADVSRWLDDYEFLERCLDMAEPFRIGALRESCSGERAAECAALCREALGLKPTEPIHDICGLLEDAGVKVLSVPMASDGFFGLSVGEGDGGPAVVVNIWERITVERRIFSAAHELGHLMLHAGAYDVGIVEESEGEEREADAFAGHFLLPDEGFRREWEESAGLHFVDRVFKVKRIYRVSYKAVLHRLVENGAADRSIWPKFNAAYQRRFNRSLSGREEPSGMGASEPVGMKSVDFFEDRFSRLAREALEREEISLARTAEMLRVGIEEMQELLRDWEAVR